MDTVSSNEGRTQEEKLRLERAAERLSSLLVIKTSTVPKNTALVLVPHKCKCAFCGECRQHTSIQWRHRLYPALKDWKAAYMITLTVDPKKFPNGPESAYDEIRGRRWIAQTVRKLQRRGHLHSDRWFYAMEFHKNGWPHWHVAVESSFVPFDLLKETWGYGGVRYSRQKSFQSVEHAIHYLTKYVSTPEHNTPNWVLNSKTRIRLVSTSRGLVPSERKRSDGSTGKTRKSKTVAQRLGTCKTKVKVVEKQRVDESTVHYHYHDTFDVEWWDEFQEFNEELRELVDCDGQTMTVFQALAKKGFYHAKPES